MPDDSNELYELIKKLKLVTLPPHIMLPEQCPNARPLNAKKAVVKPGAGPILKCLKANTFP